MTDDTTHDKKNNTPDNTTTDAAPTDQSPQTDNIADENHEKTNENNDLINQLATQAKEIDKLETIAKQTQMNYITLKRDFDAYQARMAAQADDAKVDALVTVAKKLLPAIDKLKQIVAHVPDDLRDNSRVQGVLMIDTLLNTELADLNISYESALGNQPDATKHQPIGTQVVENADQIGTIVAEVSQCVVYDDGTTHRVIREGQVTIGVAGDA